MEGRPIPFFCRRSPNMNDMRNSVLGSISKQIATNEVISWAMDRSVSVYWAIHFDKSVRHWRSTSKRSALEEYLCAGWQIYTMGLLGSKHLEPIKNWLGDCTGKSLGTLCFSVLKDMSGLLRYYVVARITRTLRKVNPQKCIEGIPLSLE